MYKIKFLIAIFSLTIFWGCKESITNTNNNDIVDQGLNKKEEIVIRALCRNEYAEYGWADVGFEVAPGKIMGIWPKDSWMQNSVYLERLRNKYGFSHLATYRSYISIATQASVGFNQENNIMALINAVDTPTEVQTSYNNLSGRPWAFYTDEPIHYAPSIGLTALRDSLFKTKAFINNTFPGSYFIGGETNEDNADLFVDIVDFINYTTYDPWPYNDQRDWWTDFNNAYGSKFNHLWISGELDYGEFGNLIGHAKNLGKNSIWFYGAQPGHADEDYWTELLSFRDYAFQNSYIYKIQRYSFNTYRCYEIDPCDCNINNASQWYLYESIPTTQVRVVNINGNIIWSGTRPL